MNNPFFQLFSFTSLIFALAHFNPPVQAQPITQSWATIKSTEANRLVKSDKAILVDVRERNEVESGLALPARWMPLSKMENDDLMYIDFISRLPKDKTIVIYCASGRRAQKAQKKLEDRGFHTENMGGYLDWVDAGLPTRRLR